VNSVRRALSLLLMAPPTVKDVLAINILLMTGHIAVLGMNTPLHLLEWKKDPHQKKCIRLILPCSLSLSSQPLSLLWLSQSSVSYGFEDVSKEMNPTWMRWSWWG